MRTTCLHLREHSESAGTLLVAAVTVITLCYAGAIAGLWQWGERVWWARFDRYSIGVLLLSGVLVAEHVHFYCKLPLRHVTVGEAFGATYDPAMGWWNAGLMFAEISAVVDYGQWRLTPWLERDGLQTIGLVLFALAVVLVAWSDRYLLRHFAVPRKDRERIRTGPYSLFRHPRYVGLFLTRVGFALALASVLAWALIPVWAAVVLRRIRIEERHLEELFQAP